VDYYSSILPQNFTVLGKLLKPLTLGKLILLHRLECYPAKNNEDIFTCVLVCSNDCTTVEDIFDDRWLGFKLWVWQLLLGKIDWDRVNALWLEYIEVQTNCPKIDSKHSSSSGEIPSGTPFLQQLKVCLQSKLHMSHAEAIALPFQQAIWDYVTYYEQEGVIDVLDTEWRKKQKAIADANHEELVKKYGGNH
jgi:hypothetical protein